MQLKIESKIDNCAMLVYRDSIDKPSGAPKYLIKFDSADEFVKEYNKQSENLKKSSVVTTLTGGFLGWSLGLLKARDNKLVSGAILSVIGMGIGFLASSIISYNKNNKLMDKYNVKKFGNK